MHQQARRNIPAGNGGHGAGDRVRSLFQDRGVTNLGNFGQRLLQLPDRNVRELGCVSPAGVMRDGGDRNDYSTGLLVLKILLLETFRGLMSDCLVLQVIRRGQSCLRPPTLRHSGQQ